MDIVRVKTIGDFCAFENELNEFRLRCQGKNLFLTFDYLYSWLESFEPQNIDVFITIKDGRITGLFPLHKYATVALPFKDFSNYQILGNGLWGYADFLVEEETLDESISFFLNYFYKSIRFCRLDIGPALADSKVFSAVCAYILKKSIVADIVNAESAPHIKIASDFKTFLKGLTRKAAAQDALRCIRRVEEVGKLTFVRFRDSSNVSPQELDSLLDIFFEMYLKQWRTNRFTKDQRFYKLYRTLAHRAYKNEYLDFSILYLDEKPIAMHYGFVLDGCRYYMTPTYNIEYGKYSPGKILLFYLIRDSHFNNVEFDFLNGMETYKLDWTKEVQQLRYLTMYSSRLTKIAVSIARIRFMLLNFTKFLISKIRL